MNNKELAERMAFLNETESGIREFSGLREEILDEGIKKGIQEGIDTTVLNMLKNGFDLYDYFNN